MTVPPISTKTITVFVDHPSEWNATDIVTPVGKFTEAASLLTSLSISTIIDKEIAVRVTNKTESLKDQKIDAIILTVHLFTEKTPNRDRAFTKSMASFPVQQEIVHHQAASQIAFRIIYSGILTNCYELFS